MDQGNMLQIKEESGDTEVDIGPTTLQHMDLHYRINQRDTSIVKQESAIKNHKVDVTMCSGVKQESHEMVLTGVDGQRCAQATLAQVGVGSVQQGNHITVKGSKLVIEPTLLQHRADQNTSIVKTEHTIACYGNDAHPGSGEKEESVEDNCREPNIYKCYFCQKTFTNEGSFKAHMTCTHSGGTFKCKQCRKSFRQKRYLMVHIADMHTARMERCNICGKSMKPGGLKTHVQRMHSDEQLQCTGCGETVRSMYYLQQHMNKHRNRHTTLAGAHLVSSKECLWSMLFSCPKCVQTFTCRDIFRQHYRSAHATECKECNKESKLEFYFHVQTTHSGVLQYECVVCKKIYKSKQCLHDHVLKDHPSGSTDAEHNIVYVCKICGKNATSEQQRHEHEINIHRQQSIEHHQQSTSSNMAEASGESKHPSIDKVNAATSASTQQQSAVVMKEESTVQELELGPVVFQHMDRNYRACKMEPLLD